VHVQFSRQGSWEPLRFCIIAAAQYTKGACSIAIKAVYLANQSYGKTTHKTVKCMQMSRCVECVMSIGEDAVMFRRELCCGIIEKVRKQLRFALG